MVAMADIELSPSQKNILTALIDLHRQKDDVVSWEEIARRTNRNPGTIRNQMQALEALQLVKGISDSKGGYKPTEEAYESVDIEQMDEPATVPLYRNEGRVEDANVSEIGFTSVHHPSLCRIEITVQGSIDRFGKDDAVKVGPTPISRLVVKATVDAKDDTNNILICRIDDMSLNGTKSDVTDTEIYDKRSQSVSFCPNCGADLDKIDDPNVCFKCGEDIPT